MNNNIFSTILLLDLGLVSFGCNTNKMNQQSSTQQIPESIQGLIVKGARLKENVILNTAPAIKKMQDINASTASGILASGLLRFEDHGLLTGEIEKMRSFAALYPISRS